MYLFELVADDLCGTVTCSRARSEVARTSLLGSAWWPGLAPRAAGMSGCGGRSQRAGRHAAGSVKAGVVWGVTSRRAGGDEGWRHPGEEFHGGVAGSWAMPVVQTTALDPNSGMSAAARRSGAAGGTSGGGVRAALTQRPRLVRPRRGCSFLVRAHRARAVPRAPTPVPGAGTGVMMAWEINTSQCRGLRWRPDRCRLRGDAAPKGRWALDLAGRRPFRHCRVRRRVGLGHARAGRGGCGPFAAR